MNNSTQEVLNNYFTKVLDNSNPIDYKQYVDFITSEDSYPELPQGTLIYAIGLNGEDHDLLITKTPQGIYQIVDIYDGEDNQSTVDDFAETLDVDLKEIVGNLYAVEVYDSTFTHLLYISHTSFSNFILFNLTQNQPLELGGIEPLTTESHTVKEMNKAL